MSGSFSTTERPSSREENCVLQSWVMELPMMQQSVLITSCRGPDTLHKEHIAKSLCRWLRRSFLTSAFAKKVFHDPYDDDGGSFTGPCRVPIDPRKTYVTAFGHQQYSIDEALDLYLKFVDEVPHHFHLHLMHAAEIIGYKHPHPNIRRWWNRAYQRMVRDAHLNPETEEQMDKRLGDNRDDWLEAEEVTADK